jgi:hypothetical protein
MLQVINGRYYCLDCGEVLDVPYRRRIKFAVHVECENFSVADGVWEKPGARVLMSGGEEVHRCEVVPW